MHELKYTNDGVKVVIEYEAAINITDQPDLSAYMLALEDLKLGGG